MADVRKSTRPFSINNTNPEPRTLDLRTTLANSWWIYRELFRRAPRDSTIRLLVTIFSAVLPTASAYYLGKFIDATIQSTTSGVSITSITQIDRPIIVWSLFLCLALVFQYITNVIDSYVSRRIDAYHMEKFTQDLFIKISHFDVQQFEDPVVSNSFQKARDNAYKVDFFWSASLNLINNMIAAGVALVICFRLTPEITLLVVLLTLPYNAIIGEATRKLWQFYNSHIEQRRRVSELNRYLSFETTMIPEHKVSGSHRYIGTIASKENNALIEERLDIFRTRVKKLLLLVFLQIPQYLVPPIYLAWRVLTKGITFGQLSFYYSRFSSLSSSISSTLSQFTTTSDAANYLGFVRDVFSSTPSITSGPKHIPATVPSTIEFVNVSFKYPKTDKYVLEKINLLIRPAEKVAIVGENGAGKTTLVKLLLRFYDPTEGEILVNGIPLSELSLDQYYDTIGVLLQDFNRYRVFTVKENIQSGDSTRVFSRQFLDRAILQADAHDFVAQLERGIDQILSKEFGGGTNLSTGQWQKIALARMFYRDRPVLILDEPTASIDAEAEYRIFKRIYNFTENKTVIIISHRFSTVRNAKQIFVLHKGKIIEQGSHDELMKKNGNYANAFSLQAKGYLLENSTPT